MRYTIGWLLSFVVAIAYAQEGDLPLQKVKNELCDQASLQRGAAFYVNHCAGCHSLQFTRFDGIAKDIGIVDKSGAVLEQLVTEDLNWVSNKNTDPWRVALQTKEGEKWFGVPPPDLSLVARSRGKDWIYTYLHSFYEDPKRPWGMNNALFPDVAMPNVLQEYQGTRVPVYRTITLKDDKGVPYTREVIDHLETKVPGTMTPAEFDRATTDLVNFLAYVGEPHQLERERLGVWVLLFLIVFTLFAYLLKREYWKDVH